MPQVDTLKACFTFKDVSAKTQEHLKQVYFNLGLCTMTCALGMYMNAYTVVSGFIAQFAAMIGMAYMTYKVSNTYESESSRLGYLKALSFCMGYLVGPLIHHLAEFEPMILIQAVSYTAIMFLSFTAISLFSKRRSYLFLGGIIVTMTSCMFWYRTLAWLFGYSRFGGEFGLVYTMCGLFVACLYVIFDTQLIIERAERGFKDVPQHSMILFMDLFELFIKVIQTLIKLSEENKKKDKKKRKD